MDALQALLGAKPASEITDKVTIKRLGQDFTIKALTGDDIDKIREQATYPVKKGKKTELTINEQEVARLLIAKGTVEPDFSNADLLKHVNATDAGECVQKALLAGEIAALQEAILQLSGFGDFDEEVDEVKN
jgi:hypothetical protein